MSTATTAFGRAGKALAAGLRTCRPCRRPWHGQQQERTGQGGHDGVRGSNQPGEPDPLTGAASGV